ncbi:MAG: response regulator [Kaiparowitsia implicata GSE-PSE-MK54-09C]|jgi:chemosensory pili system protein ChpA (sensor histidine kinase/response regulator)|nr:response regulator [Kaiparowitsia implicata GSE-PSE-MK54-09C]
MLSEQQQRILGYFIEEAKDHLNTIEQGLLNLQDTIADADLASEVFRAAHSVKGGAAMLGLDSIQHTSHRLEDYFKVLKECPVRVDQKLESLLLNVFDVLKELLDQLQGPFGLTEDKAAEVMASVDPIFNAVNEHLNELVQQSGSIPPEDVELVPAAPTTAPPRPTTPVASGREESVLQLIFQSDVPARLRDMLQVFKQPETTERRQQLQSLGQTLEQYGEQLELPQWVELLRQVNRAIANPDASFRALAPVVIRDIKRAQEMVLEASAGAITASASLQDLVPAAPDPVDALADLDLFATDADLDFDMVELEQPEITSAFGFDEADPMESMDSALASEDHPSGSPPEDLLSMDELFGEAANEAVVGDRGPQVGSAELNSLADLFELESDELSIDWQDESSELSMDEMPEPLELDPTNDFSDLLGGSDLAVPIAQSGMPEEGDGLSGFFDAAEAENLNNSEFDDSFLALDEDLGDGAEDAVALNETNNALGAAFDAAMAAEEWVPNAGNAAGDADLTGLNELFSDPESDPESERSPNALAESEYSDSSDLSWLDGSNQPLDASSEEVGDANPFAALGDDLDMMGAGTTPSSEQFNWDGLDGSDLDLLEGEAASDDSLDLDGMDEANSSDDFGELDLNASGSPISDTDASGIEASAPDMSDLFGGDEPDFGELDLDASGSDSSDTDASGAEAEALDMSDFFGDDESGFGELDLDASGSDSSDADALGVEASALDMSDLFGDEDPDAAIALPNPAESDRYTADLSSDFSLDSAEDSVWGVENLVETSPDAEASIDEAADTPNWLDALDSDQGLEGLDTAPALWDAADEDVSADLWTSPEFDLDDPSHPLNHLEQETGAAAPELFSDAEAKDGAIAPDISEDHSTESPALDLDAAPETAFDQEQDETGAGLDGLPVEAIEAAADAQWGEESSEDDSFAAAQHDLLFGDTEGSLGTLDFESSAVDLEVAASTLDSDSDFLFDTLEGNDLENEETAGTFSPNFEAEGATDAADLWDLDSLLDDAADAADAQGMLTTEETAFGSLDALLAGDDIAEASSVSIDDLPEADSQTDPASSADFLGLDGLLSEDDVTATSDVTFNTDDSSASEGLSEFGDLDDLDRLLNESDRTGVPNPSDSDFLSGELGDFDDLDALLNTPTESSILGSMSPAASDDFSDLEALLGEGNGSFLGGDRPTAPPAADDDEFEDLEQLLESANSIGGSPPVKGVRTPSQPSSRRPTRPPGVLSDQTMRVSVKNLDNFNNLVGELVVNRNSLEQAEERLRQFLDNLLYQVQQLSDVGQRMRDLYERSLLESSLLSNRRSYPTNLPGRNAPSVQPSHATGINFDALEMDRFTGFHTLSQEMIELIVRVRESASDIDFVVEETDQVTRNFRQITTQLQESLTRARMVPFAQTADRLPRAVRDISLRCGKQAELVIEGRETLIDKMILEQLYDPMTHLVNNAITHGVETPEERQAAGKEATGRISIRAFHQGNQTVISITDDGAGIDPERIKRKAIEKGLITERDALSMSRLDVYDLIFHHGFSTRDKADDFAGRGIGMDVVRTSLNEVRGVVNIDSAVGRGTTFTIRLPLTLSISKALCCISNRARIAFPMDGVEDMLDVPRDRVQTDEQGRPCIHWHDQLLPFQPLSELLKFNRSLGRGSVYGGNQEEDIISVIVLRSNAGSYLALQVDQVLGEQEIVIKQLEGPMPKPVGIAGATVLGDGRIMPIADVLELIDLSMGRIRREAGSLLWEQDGTPVAAEPEKPKTEPTVLIVDDSITVRELLSMTFNKVGYRVEQARDGQEAWEKLRSGLPCDLVFCDIEMPRMDGLELLSRLQKDGHLNRIPIAMLTSRGADRHRQMAIQLGAKGYFTKPYLEEVLLDAAQRMLKGEVLVSLANSNGK